MFFKISEVSAPITEGIGAPKGLIGNLYEMGKGGLEPPRLSAHDPKSCSFANSDTSPIGNHLIQ
jgi:hypothetical protein